MICVEWPNARTSAGYGVERVKGVNYLVHRTVFEKTWCEIPAGMVVMHTCDNRGCINPLHLMLGTQGDNLRDMTRKGRHGRYNAKKTHCVNGHEFSEENTYWRPSGGRSCRDCKRDWEARR
jgi:hypothetical protein